MLAFISLEIQYHLYCINLTKMEANNNSTTEAESTQKGLEENKAAVSKVQ